MELVTATSQDGEDWTVKLSIILFNSTQDSRVGLVNFWDLTQRGGPQRENSEVPLTSQFQAEIPLPPTYTLPN